MLWLIKLSESSGKSGWRSSRLSLIEHVPFSEQCTAHRPPTRVEERVGGAPITQASADILIEVSRVSQLQLGPPGNPVYGFALLGKR